ncbi:hypothetical protein VE03_05134 [Pseudogymnoascus sp. 23342-1-I1]|nr:hypothetical protein VE03_05134 [Pseudogymnoascus sp. 23342-1-I1]
MAARNKGPVFRVTGLPALQPDDELKAALKAAIDDNLAEDEQLKLTPNIAIVPSCYDNDEKVALVEFRGGVPAFLSELMANPLGDWQVEMGDTDISFDQHFFGFTQLYTPKPGSPATADIIAITGLDGHAYGSWRAKKNLKRMWLRDFLSKDLPCCRTMIYGYNSKLSSHGINTIMDYGREFLEAIKRIRHTQEARCIARCLVKAVQTDERDNATIAALHKATYGILFFGAPHKGLVIDDIQRMVAGNDHHPRMELLEQIKLKSDLLMYQLIDFKNLIRDRKIVSFYERHQTRRLQLNPETNKWGRTGEYMTAVESGSALLELPDSTEAKIPVDADHSQIVKFDNRNAEAYKAAVGYLKEFEQDARKVVSDRFSQAQNRPKPSSMVPFRRDSAFVGREDILAEIGKKLERGALEDHSRVALVGLGGIGKSQIAIEYAYRLRDSAPQTWVFWVHASDAARFKLAYRNIAAKVELPGWDNPKADILHLVKNWLCDERNGRWLIILDNADDDRVFSSTSANSGGIAHGVEAPCETAPLESFLPQSLNGWILVTSRDLVAAVNLIGTRHNAIQVAPMAEEDALMLLETRISVTKAFEDDAKTLVQTLEYIPLAITHAAAYLAVRAETITVSTYLELFRESEENQAHLLSSREARDMRRDGSVSDAVITTWQISFEQIRKTRPEAAELLSLMAMFDRQGIPESILYDGRGRLQFLDAVTPLARFSLIKAQSTKQPEQQDGEHLFEMHGLVQLATRKWLEVQGQVGRWQKASLRIVAAAFPSGQHETWAVCRALLPHAQKVLGYVVEEMDATLDRARIADNTVWYLLLAGEYAAAEKIGRTAVVGREDSLGIEHPDTLTSVSQLGSVLERQGKYEEAEAMHRRALEGNEKVLGVEHPDTLTSVSQLGLVLERQAMQRRDLQGSEKVLRVEHPDTLTSVSNLGSVLERQGKYKEAEAMHRRALELREKVLGVEHPDTLTSVSKLGSVLERQGKYEEAEAMHRRALELREKVLGVEHPETLTSVSNLGSVLERQRKHEEAEGMHRRALEGYEKVVGVEHPHTLTSMANLASTLWNQGQWQEAEDMEMRLMETRQRVLGHEHPDTLMVMGNLAVTLKSQSRNKEAISLMNTCVQLQERVFGRHHPDTKSFLETLNEWQMENRDIGV